MQYKGNRRGKRKKVLITRRIKRILKRGKIDRKKLIKSAMWILMILLLTFSLRYAYFYVTESGTDPDDPYPVNGVDVSSYQGDINWKGLASEDIRFAYIKATEGSGHVDSRFEYNWLNAGKTAMKVGAYHFLSFDSKGDSQADNFIKHVDKKRRMLPPAVDVEMYGRYLKKPPHKNKVKRILDEILYELEEEYGFKPVIYTNKHVYSNYISGNYDGYPIWISDFDISDKLPDGRDWLFCQYTFKGRSKYVNDGKKYVDMNVFKGSKWDFRKYKGR